MEKVTAQHVWWGEEVKIGDRLTHFGSQFEINHIKMEEGNTYNPATFKYENMLKAYVSENGQNFYQITVRDNVMKPFNFTGETIIKKKREPQVKAGKRGRSKKSILK